MAVSENPRAHRPDHVFGSGIAGQNDPGVRLYGANLAGDPQTVGAITSLARQHDIERKSSQAVLGVGFPKSVVYGMAFVFQDAAKQFVRGTVGVDKQQTAGTQGISIH